MTEPPVKRAVVHDPAWCIDPSPNRRDRCRGLRRPVTLGHHGWFQFRGFPHGSLVHLPTYRRFRFQNRRKAGFRPAGLSFGRAGFSPAG